jgi:hypothetical protein
MPDTRLICYLVRDVADTPPTLSHVDACCNCRRTVWRSLLSPPAPAAICQDCVVQAASTGEQITVLPPTRQQRAAIRKYFADRG